MSEDRSKSTGCLCQNIPAQNISIKHIQEYSGKYKYTFKIVQQLFKLLSVTNWPGESQFKKKLDFFFPIE